MLSIRELRDRAVIRPVKRAVEDQLLDLPGVTAVDIGERCVAGRHTGEQVIVVSVRRKKPSVQLPLGNRVPDDILGIPVDVIEEEPTLHHVHRRIRGLGELHDSGETRDSGEALNNTFRGRQYGSDGRIRGGAGIAPCRAVHLHGPCALVGSFRRIGTLGALVTGPPPAMAPMGLTTFDVACMDDAWSVGDQMIDPESGCEYANLARAALSGRVDAAAVTLTGGFGYSYEIRGIGPVTGQCAAYPGEVVRKSGFGTALTSGIVVSTDATLRIDHGDALGVRVLREQIRVVAEPPEVRFAGDGDAGAVLVNSDGRIVGLHLGGTSDGGCGFASPIGDVLAELDVELGVATRCMGA